uniref:Glycolipid transfer protein domain-containing protein n=1 Tax=Timema genevievae TaxID=629358 RepID=A0A7R9PN07_TIMGE|nr:unnamed protein product [Timema genevievae]
MKNRDSNELNIFVIFQKLTKTYSDNPERYTYLNDMVLHEKEKGGNVATDALLWLRRALHFVYTFFHCIVEDTEKGRKTEDLVPFLKKAYKDVLERYHGWMAQQLFSLNRLNAKYNGPLLTKLPCGRPVQSVIMLAYTHKNISTPSEGGPADFTPPAIEAPPTTKKKSSNLTQPVSGTLVGLVTEMCSRFDFNLLSRMCPTRKDLLLNIALGLENREDFVIRDMTRFLGGLEINIQALSAFYTAHDLESTARV